MKLSKKLFTFFFIALAALTVIFTAVFCVRQSRISSVKLENTQSSLTAKDKNARKGSIKDTGSAMFAFSQEQKQAFEQQYNKNQSAALIIRVEFTPTAAQKELLTTGTSLPFNYGILYQEDFDNKGRLKEPLTSKISVYADLEKKLSYADNQPLVLDFSMAIPKSEHIQNFLPQGFFINSSVCCKIVSACAGPALVGFDTTQDILFYGFSSNGGIVNFANNSVDFSGSSLSFPVQNTSKSIMPQIFIKLDSNPELKDKRVRLNIGGENLYVSNVKNVDTLVIPSASLKSPFANAELTENNLCISAFYMQSTPLPDADERPYKAIRTDPGLILNYNTKNWRQEDYEVFEWDRYDRILFFDIKDYDIQDNFFRRLAYYVEKRGYKGKLWSNADLEGKHGYNAHDYSSESLASFFNKAREEDFTLNPEEETLKKILLANGLLVADGQKVKANGGGLVSISRQSDAFTRSKLLAHEAWHTLFFRDEAFRNFVAAVYYTFDPDSRQFLLDFFESQSGLGYDIEDEYLMHNEFMAYILQQPLKDVSEYFVGRTNLYSVRVFTPVLSEYVRATNAKGFEDAAVILNDYIYDEYGISGGVVGLIQRK